MTKQGTKIKTISRFEYIDYTAEYQHSCSYDSNWEQWIYEGVYYFKNADSTAWGGDLDVYSIRADVDFFPLDYVTGLPKGNVSFELQCGCGIDKVYGKNSGLDHYPYCDKATMNGLHRGQKQ